MCNSLPLVVLVKRSSQNGGSMDITEDDLTEIRRDLADMQADQEAEWEALNEPPSCPICDAWNCGGDGLGCYRYEGRGEYVDPRDLDPVF